MHTEYHPDPLHFVKCFKTSSSAYEILLTKLLTLKKSAYSDALFEGCFALNQQVKDCAKAVKVRGQLLLLGGAE